METNIKVVGFADQSINGVTIKNQGFDLEYDGKIMNMSGFSGDKLYYAKLNNQQLMSLLQLPSSEVPLEQRIKNYKDAPLKRKVIIYKPHTKRHKKTPKKMKTLKIVKIKSPSSHKSKSYKSRYRTPTPYFTPKMRSEYKKSIKHSSRTKTKPKSISSSRSSKSKTIY